MSSLKQKESNLLVRMHPLQRLAISILLVAVTIFFLKHSGFSGLLITVCSWCVFALSFIATSWVVLFTRTLDEIKKYAKKEDGSRVFVILINIVSSFAAMIAVLLLVIDKNRTASEEWITVPACILSVILAWVMVHTIMTFHYTNLYYDDDKKKKKEQQEGLLFPGDEQPDYLDFAYFSFVVGMTFQVSDVEITDKKMRKIVLSHGLISFALNTFVVALTINFIAGLSK
jgi:uncharacterized membrane protein